MFAHSTQLRGCDACLRSTATGTKTRTASIEGGRPNRKRRRVLIVEFRDEVFAVLKALFEEHRYQVKRAVSGGGVATEVKRFAPDLVLVNEAMPYENGWLITCKLRLTQFHAPVWLYAPRQSRPRTAWKKLSGADEVIAYGGVIGRLDTLVRQRLRRGAAFIHRNADFMEAAQTAAARQRKCA